VLSGFLITSILLDAKTVGAAPAAALAPFYVRRALRILPLAWLVALIVAFITGEWKGALWYAAYLANWLPNPPPPRDIGHYWTLAVEEQFYCVWPALVLAFSNKTLRRICLATVFAAMLARAALVHWHPPFATDRFLDHATLVRADPLAAGAYLALLWTQIDLRSAVTKAAVVAILGATVTVGLFALDAAGVHAGTVYVLRELFIAVTFTAAVLLVLQRSPRWLAARWLTWLGTVSYGLYVIHGCLNSWIHNSIDHPVLRTLALAGLSIPLAALSWRYFESPILGLKKRWPMPRAGSRSVGPGDSASAAPA
jgi:peptidoglycan/LPS O-acetylase OafA/YrhL